MPNAAGHFPAPGQLLAPVCRACGYFFDGLSDSTTQCPECGAAVPRFPLTPVFVCEADPARRPPPLINASTLPLLLGIPVAAVVGVWREMHRKSPHLWTPIALCAGVALVFALCCMLARWTARQGRDSRVMVDLSFRRFRFERCVIHPNMGWPRSTGPALDIPFEELLGARLSAYRSPARLTLSTPYGTITVSDRLTNFHSLASVAVALADPPARPSQLAISLALLIPTVILTGVLFQLGIWLHWW